jgi:hypothetical protein
MVRGIEGKCSSMEVNGLIQISLHTPLLESDSMADGKVVERQTSIIIGKGVVSQCTSMELNGLIQVRQGTPPLLESDSNAMSMSLRGDDQAHRPHRHIVPYPSGGNLPRLETPHGPRID